jgi:hypothetical protein
MDREQARIEREHTSQGAQWGAVHHGYFGREDVAAPLVDAVFAAFDGTPPAVLADLGGGTGFLLGQVLQRDPSPPFRLVNVDLSADQLAECHGTCIEPLQVSASKVLRAELGVSDGRLLLMMRSVLHYFGHEGALRLLRHLRGQMEEGEAFVHQTACFWLAPHRRCINLLYQRMATGKYYPLVGELEFLLNKAGFEVLSAVAAPSLILDSPSLATRYDLTDELVQAIRDELLEDFGALPHVFQPEPVGFTAWLHYHIFTCRAV